jgi:hypothetical protein
MVAETKPARVTVDLGSRELLRRLKHAAVENDMSLRDVVVEAVSFWLDHQDEVEDTLAREKIARVESESSSEPVAHTEVRSRAGLS